MASVESLPTKTRLSIGAKILVGITGLLSIPSYLSLFLLVLQKVTADPGIRNFSGLSDWAYILEFGSLFFLPLAILVALAGTALPVMKRGKVVAWEIIVGGVLSWLIATQIQPKVIW